LAGVISTFWPVPKQYLHFSSSDIFGSPNRPVVAVREVKQPGQDRQRTQPICRAAARVVPAAPLPDAAIDISQHAPRSVREDAVVVVDVPNINGTENDQKSYEHSHFISLFAAFSPISTGRAAWL
jgi:hypothetical protein